MTNVIEIDSLHYRPGKGFALKDLSIHVPAGAIYGFLGPNGSGKTTTIRLVLGLLRAQSGRITVLGDAMPGDAPKILARVGYVPEQPHLDPTLTVDEILRFQAAFYPTWDHERAAQLLRQFQLDGERLFGRLSKGQKAKVMILLALAQQGDLLVLDEPTDGLDPVVRRDILAALLDYVSQRGAAVFISSHLVHEIERICDWIAVMDDGRLVTEVPMAAQKRHKAPPSGRRTGHARADAVRALRARARHRRGRDVGGGGMETGDGGLLPRDRRIVAGGDRPRSRRRVR